MSVLSPIVVICRYSVSSTQQRATAVIDRAAAAAAGMAVAAAANKIAAKTDREV